MIFNNHDIPEARSQLNNIPIYKTAELPSSSKEFNASPLLLGSNENRLGASPTAISAIKNYLISENLALYPNFYRSHLIQQLVQFHHVPTDFLFIGNGSLDVMQTIIRTFSDRNDEVIISEFAYAQIPILCQTEGLKIIKVPAKDYGHDLNSMALHINSKTKMIIVVNPNNPTGTWLDETSFKQFLLKVSKKILVVVDEAYFEYLQSITSINTVKMLAEFPNLILVRTFSKVYGLAGLRIGYALGCSALIKAMAKVQPPFAVNTLALIAASAALSDFQHVNETVRITNQGMQLLKNHLKKLNIHYVNSAANFLMIETGKLTHGLYAYLKQNNIYVRPLDNYSLSSFLRITIGQKEDMLALLHHLKYYLIMADLMNLPGKIQIIDTKLDLTNYRYKKTTHLVESVTKTLNKPISPFFTNINSKRNFSSIRVFKNQHQLPSAIARNFPISNGLSNITSAGFFSRKSLPRSVSNSLISVAKLIR